MTTFSDSSLDLTDTELIAPSAMGRYCLISCASLAKLIEIAFNYPQRTIRDMGFSTHAEAAKHFNRITRIKCP